MSAIRRTPIAADPSVERCVLAFSAPEEVEPIAGVPGPGPFDVVLGNDTGYTATPSSSRGTQWAVLCPRRDQETSEVVFVLERVGTALDLRRNNTEVRFCEADHTARLDRYDHWGNDDDEPRPQGSPSRDEGTGLDAKRPREEAEPVRELRPFKGPLLIDTTAAAAPVAAAAVAPSAPVPPPAPVAPAVPTDPAAVAAPGDLPAAVAATVVAMAGRSVDLAAVLSDVLQRTAEFALYRGADRAVSKAWFRVCKAAVRDLLAARGCTFPSDKVVAFPPS